MRVIPILELLDDLISRITPAHAGNTGPKGEDGANA